MRSRRKQTGVPREKFDFDRRPNTGQSFENALAKARAGERRRQRWIHQDAR